MRCTKLYVGLSLILCSALFGCSDAGPVPFPPGVGEDDAGQTPSAPASGFPDALAPDSGTESLDDEHDVSEDPPPDGPGAAFPDVSDAGDGQEPSVDAAPDAVVDAGQEVSPYEPAVVIISPLDGAVVQNPVAFEIASRNVAYVQLFADQYALSEPWDPCVNTMFQYDFIGVDYPREIQLVGLDVDQEPVTAFTITITVVD